VEDLGEVLEEAGRFCFCSVFLFVFGLCFSKPFYLGRDKETLLWGSEVLKQLISPVGEAVKWKA
jgi:hypothetical protein